MHVKDRIIFLILSAVVLLGAFALYDASGQKAESEAGGPVTLAVATDLHYISPGLTDNGPAFTELVTDADGKVMLRIDELVRAFAAQLAGEKPDALILSGDLSFNGARQSHEDLAGILRGLEDAGVPVYVIPGNHDLHSKSAARFEGEDIYLVESVTASEFAEIYAEFGFDEALSRDSASLSYSVRPAPGLRLLLVDVNSRSSPGWAADETLAWVESQLNEAGRAGERVVAVSHQNLYAHNPMLTSGYMISNSAQLETLYENAGVLLNLSGHIHLQHLRTDREVPELVTSSLAVSPNQYGVLTLDGEHGSYRTERVELEGFAEYSEGFFRDTAMAQAMAELDGCENAGALAGLYADANALYFAGRPDLLVWDEELLAEWQSHSFFIPMYLESIRAGGGADQTRYEW